MHVHAASPLANHVNCGRLADHQIGSGADSVVFISRLGDAVKLAVPGLHPGSALAALSAEAKTLLHLEPLWGEACNVSDMTLLL